MKDTTFQALSKVCRDLAEVTNLIAAETQAIIATGDHVELIKHFDSSRKAVELTKSARESLRNMADAMSQEHIPDLFRNLKEKTGQKPPFVIEGVGRVTVSHRWACTIIDKPRGYQWLRDTDNGSLIVETVNAQTLASFAKEEVTKKGKDLPEDIFKTSINPYTSITKA